MAPDPVTAELLAKGPLAREGAPFVLVRIEGPDAGDFLQRLCSQDVLGVADGVAAPAAFLDAKGKVLVTCLALRAGDTFWLELQQEQAPRLLELLDRYHFSEKLTVASDERPCREVVGAATGAAARPPAPDADHVVVAHARRGVGFVRSHGVVDGDGAAAPLTPELAECLRMAAGLVRVGVETEPTTLVLEADLDDHCSTTKGCYTGQEIVARIHTYGHTNRKLCFLHLGPGDAITSPQPLHEPEDDVPVGRVMHAVPVPGRALRFGLGYLPLDFQQPGSRLKLADGAEATVVW